MATQRIITLLTDFGESDGFVGTMKGVILSINPSAQIVDISHQVPSQDIEAGAFILNSCYHYFPPGTIHVAVVDPGVGSDRKILAVAAGEYFFVAPDNEILKYIFHSNETLTVVEVLNKQYFLKTISQTFHGRDIFAPVAAHLSNGVSINALGPIKTDFKRGRVAIPQISGSGITGKIIYVDKFGNLITNIQSQLVLKRNFSLKVGNNRIERLSSSYAEVEIGTPLAIPGSTGFVEIAVRNGNARKKLAVKPGDTVQLTFHNK